MIKAATTIARRHSEIRKLLEHPGAIVLPQGFQTLFTEGHSLYAIPLPLLEVIQRLPCDKQLFSAAELQIEQQFSQYCQDHQCFGFSPRGPFSFDLLEQETRISLSRFESLVEWIQANIHPGIKVDVKKSIDCWNEGRGVKQLFNQQRLAYLGWLISNPQFQKERQELWEQWIASGANPAYLGGRNLLISWTEPPAQANDGHRNQISLARVFLSFYRRWHLDGFATWDLPVTHQPNLGGPAWLGEQMDLGDCASIQLPSTMKLPSRVKPAQLLPPASNAHLEEWQAILQQNGLKKYAELFIIHFYQEVVLRPILGARLYRQKELVDRLLAQSFKKGAPLKGLRSINPDTIKKLRLLYESRLRVIA